MDDVSGYICAIFLVRMISTSITRFQNTQQKSWRRSTKWWIDTFYCRCMFAQIPTNAAKARKVNENGRHPHHPWTRKKERGNWIYFFLNLDCAPELHKLLINWNFSVPFKTRYTGYRKKSKLHSYVKLIIEVSNSRQKQKGSSCRRGGGSHAWHGGSYSWTQRNWSSNTQIQ